VPFSILHVCTGNVCRSPFAERLTIARLDAELGAGGHDVNVCSAGLRGMVGHPMDTTAAAEMARHGVGHEGFLARELSPADLQRADLVLTATRIHRRLVLELDPRALHRSFTILEFADLVGPTGPVTSPRELVAQAAARRSTATLTDYDVPDPIGRSPQVHAEVADTIAAAVGTIADALAASIRNGR